MDFREVDTESKDIAEEVVTTEEGIEETSQKQDDSNDYEDICYICRRPESIAGKMINIYGGVKICVDCMQRTMETMNSSGFSMPPGMSFQMNDFNNMFGGIPGGGDMDGMFGGIPQSQRFRKENYIYDRKKTEYTKGGFQGGAHEYNTVCCYCFC